MTRFGMMSRLAATVLGIAIAISALASVSAQPEPPHRFYGTEANPGDTITAMDAMGEIGSAMVSADGSWFIDVETDRMDDVSFMLNGAAADAEVTPRGSQSEVSLTVAMMDEGDSMMGEDDTLLDEEGSMMGEDDESMMGEDDSMMGEDDHMMSDYPATGSGGLVDASGGISAGLAGLLVALATAAVIGLGLRRLRSRA